MTGRERLRAQLQSMRQSLRAFEDPVVADVPGLRLMRDTLQEREQHIARSIERAETCSIEIELRGAAVDARGVPAALVASVLAGVDAAVGNAALHHVRRWATPTTEEPVRAASALYVAQLDVGESVTLLLSRRPGPLEAQLADPTDGVPVVEHAAAAVTRHLVALVDDAEADAAPPRELMELARVLSDRSIVLRWTLTPALLDPMSLDVDAGGWQRLLRQAPD